MVTTIIDHDFTTGANVALTSYTEEGIGYIQVFLGGVQTAEVRQSTDSVRTTAAESNSGYIYRVDLAATNADYSVEAASVVNLNHNKRPNIVFGRLIDSDNWYGLARYRIADNPDLVLGSISDIAVIPLSIKLITLKNS